VTYIQLRSGTY